MLPLLNHIMLKAPKVARGVAKKGPTLIIHMRHCPSGTKVHEFALDKLLKRHVSQDNAALVQGAHVLQHLAKVPRLVKRRVESFLARHANYVNLRRVDKLLDDSPDVDVLMRLRDLEEI